MSSDIVQTGDRLKIGPSAGVVTLELFAHNATEVVEMAVRDSEVAFSNSALDRGFAMVERAAGTVAPSAGELASHMPPQPRANLQSSVTGVIREVAAGSLA